MSAPTKAPPAESVDQQVVRLLKQWRDETAVISSSTVIASHPALCAIVALGPAALPALFRDLAQTRNGHMDTALTAITGVQPVPVGKSGRMREIANIWVQWAKENGYLE